MSGASHRYRARVAKRERPGAEPTPGLARLPPGRHGLSREFVAQNQRERITAGVIAAVAEHGYHDATIAEIAAAAGVARRAIYSYFGSKEACLLDTYDLITGHIEAAMAAALAAEGDASWPDRVRVQLRALLEVFATNPDLATYILIAAPGGGEPILGRYREFLSAAFKALISGAPKPIRPLSANAEQAVIGGVAALIVNKVRAGEGSKLPEIESPLLELVLVPYLGREDAARIAR